MRTNAQRAIALFQKAAAYVMPTPPPTESRLSKLKKDTKELLKKMYKTEIIYGMMEVLLDGMEAFTGTVGEKLGSGSFGNVYLAVEDGKSYAVKTTQCEGNTCDLDACENSVDLIHEFQLQQLAAEKSSHVVKPHKLVLLDSGRIGIVMDKIHLEGAVNAISVLTRKEERKKLGITIEDAKLLIYSIWKELNEINDTGILHGDTPANIVIGKNSSGELTFQIFDFGRALFPGERASDFYKWGNRTFDSTQWLFSVHHHAMVEATGNKDPFCSEIVSLLSFVSERVKERLSGLLAKDFDEIKLLKKTAVKFKYANGNNGVGFFINKKGKDKVLIKTSDGRNVVVGKNCVEIDATDAHVTMYAAHIGFITFRPSFVLKKSQKRGLKRKQSNQVSKRVAVRKCI